MHCTRPNNASNFACAKVKAYVDNQTTKQTHKGKITQGIYVVRQYAYMAMSMDGELSNLFPLLESRVYGLHHMYNFLFLKP